LPAPDAFNAIRQAAAGRHLKTLAVLVDEAQAFFPRSGGEQIGDRLKTLLENDWAVREEGRKAALAFGLVGLPSLVERAGQNLMGLMRPLEGSDIDEEVLNTLILRFTNQRLFTTRDARAELARRSRNVFILKTLLERLVSIVASEGRAWASLNDVLSVERSLRADLEAGQEVAVQGWVRDALNDADTVNEWQPNPSLPVAVALAALHTEGHSLDRGTYERCEPILRQWCREAAQDEFTVATYPRLRFEEHARTLGERGVFSGGEFDSQLLEAWLVGLHRTFPKDEAERRAILSGAMLRVRTPSPLEPLDSQDGAEARLFAWANSAGERLGVRRVRLVDEEHRRRFMQAAEAVGRLREQALRHMAGSDYVFDLREVGLAAEDDSVALMIYRWIDGVDLQSRVGELSEVTVAEIGLRLARAVRFLHANGILHRDIRPRNIILADDPGPDLGIRPVLIDFGLARLEGREMRTRIDSDCSAPEVERESPIWTRAADVYALGRTLQALLSKDGDTGVLHDCVRGALAQDATARPTVDEMHEALTRGCQDLQVDARRGRAWTEVLSICGADSSLGFFGQTLHKAKSRFEGFDLGLHRDAFERCAELADFANQVLEARFGRGSGLGWLKEKGPPELRTDAITTLHRLRTNRNHGAGMAARIRLESTVVVKHTVEGMEAIGLHLKVRSLGTLARRFAAPAQAIQHPSPE
jgi:tRNA A-37 threonylcarbamoyl transferase component Bud32